ncbi:MAG: 2Fe-2S iron-sulfur cluster-binding protein, partial [Nostoc sp.]
VGSELARLQQIASSQSKVNAIAEITIAPLGNMPVIKDLVVDMSSFWNNLEAVAPYVSTAARQVPEREFLQTPQERSRLDQTGNCIMCGACYSECNALEVNPDFVGPHALAK